MEHNIDTCTCSHCIAAWVDLHSTKKGEEVKKNVIKVQKVLNQGEMPPFLGVAHRHFEKSKPAVGGKKDSLVIDVGLLAFLLPTPLIDTIESVSILYEK